MDMNDPIYNANLGAQMMMGAPEQAQPMTGEDQTPRSNQENVDDEIRSMILKRKEASRSNRSAKKEIWDQCWNYYKQVYNKTNKEAWQSTTFIPASPKTSEVILANMQSALLSPERPVEYQPRQPEFENPVRDVNDLIAVDMDSSNFKVHMTDTLRTLVVIGTGIGKVEYIKESATVTIKERNRTIPGMDMMRRMLGLPPAPTETSTTKQMLVKDNAATRNVDPYNFYPEPGAEDIDKDHWYIEEGKICNYKLIELSKDPESHVRNITDDLLSNNPSTVDSNPEKVAKDAVLDDPIKATAYMDPDQEHVHDEYWGPAPIWMVQPDLYGKDEHKYEMVNARFWLIDGTYVVLSEVTPFRDAEPPYFKGVYIRVPGQFWGIGPLELISSLQGELNERVNTQQDEINLKLSKPIAVIKSMIAVGESGRLVSGPGALWLFDNTDDIKKAMTTIDYDTNLNDSWRAIEWLLNEIQEVSAAVKAVIGNDGGGGADSAGTFRGQVLNKQVASDRFILYAKIFEKTALSKAYAKYYQRIYQYKDWNAATQILGQKRGAQFQFISPEDLDKMARIVPMGVTTMENKGIKLAQKSDEFKMFMGQPWFKAVDAAREIVDIGGGVPDRTIMSDEELTQFNEARRQMFQQQGMGDMGGQPGIPQEGPQSSPVAGNVPGPTDGLPQPSMPPRGPGAAPIDFAGRPL